MEPDKPPAMSLGRRIGLRLFALLLVGAFAAVQYHWWQDGVRFRAWWEPTPVLGPLYFLANGRSDDAWLGFALLAVLAPCILAFPVWPTRRTAVLASLAILAWVGPGILHIAQRAP